MKRVNIIGIGNYSIKEDSIGLEAIDAIDKLLAEREYILEDQNGNSILVQLHLANQDPILAGAIIAEGTPVLIVDAVDMKLPSGTVRTFSLNEAILNFSQGAISTHGLDLAETLKLVDKLGYGSSVKIIGIQIDREKLDFSQNNPTNNHKEKIKREIISKILEEVKQIA